MNKAMSLQNSVNVREPETVLKSMKEYVFVQGHVYRRLLWACISVSFDYMNDHECAMQCVHSGVSAHWR